MLSHKINKLGETYNEYILLAKNNKEFKNEIQTLYHFIQHTDSVSELHHEMTSVLTSSVDKKPINHIYEKVEESGELFLNIDSDDDDDDDGVDSCEDLPRSVVNNELIPNHSKDSSVLDTTETHIHDINYNDDIRHGIMKFPIFSINQSIQVTYGEVTTLQLALLHSEPIDELLHIPNINVNLTAYPFPPPILIAIQTLNITAVKQILTRATTNDSCVDIFAKTSEMYGIYIHHTTDNRNIYDISVFSNNDTNDIVAKLPSIINPAHIGDKDALIIKPDCGVLHMAVATESLELVKLVVQYLVDTDKESVVCTINDVQCGETCMSLAMWNKHFLIFDHLLKCLNKHNGVKETIMVAIINHHYKVLQYIATLFDVNVKLTKQTSTLDKQQQTTPLITALYMSDLVAMNILCDAGADINAPVNNFNNATPLFHAISNNRIDIINILLLYNVNVNNYVYDENHTFYKQNFTPLHVAIEQGNFTVVTTLLQNGANVDAPACGKPSMTALALAIDKDNVVVARRLLKYNAKIVFGEDNLLIDAILLKKKAVQKVLLNDPRVIHAKSPYINKALLTACYTNQYQLCETLLAKGADPFAIIDTSSCFHHVIVGNLNYVNTGSANNTHKREYDQTNIPILKLLLTSAPCRCRSGSSKSNQVNRKKKKKLKKSSCSCVADHLNTINIIANTNHHEPYHTLLTAACHHGNPVVVALLLKYQASIWTPTVDKMLPIHVAAQCGHLDVLKVLVNHANDKTYILATTPTKDLPIHIASYNNHHSIVTYLLSQGSVVKQLSSRNTLGRSVLHCAAEKNNCHVLDVLLPMFVHHKLSVDCVDDNGYSPVHLAVLFDSMDSVELLLRYNASPVQTLGKKSLRSPAATINAKLGKESFSSPAL